MGFLSEVFDRLFNPHRKHGYITGPRFSPFWFDLESMGSQLSRTRRLDRSALADWVRARQRYEILRTAHYHRFAHASTVGHQLAMAVEEIRGQLRELSQFAPHDEPAAIADKLLMEVTDQVESELIEQYGSMLDRDLAFWSGEAQQAAAGDARNVRA